LLRQWSEVDIFYSFLLCDTGVWRRSRRWGESEVGDLERVEEEQQMWGVWSKRPREDGGGAKVAGRVE